MFIVKNWVFYFANFCGYCIQIWILYANVDPVYTLASQGPDPHPLPMQSVHRLNMELVLQSLLGLHVHSCTHWLIPRNPTPPPAFGLIYAGAFGQTISFL
jgi:hypothetical protein